MFSKIIMKRIRKYIVPVVTLLVGFASFSGLLGFMNTQMLSGWLKPGVGGTWIWLAVAFALMCFLFVLTVMSGRIKASEAFSKLLRNLLFFAVCVALAWGASLLAGRIEGSEMSGLLFIGVFLAVIAIFGVQYLVGSSKAAKLASANSLRKSAAGAGAIRYDYASLFGGAMLVSLLLIAGLAFGVDVKILLMVFSLVGVAFLLWRLTGWRGWLMIAVAYATALLFCRLDDAKYSFEQFPYIIALTYSILAIAMPCVDLYSRSEDNL